MGAAPGAVSDAAPLATQPAAPSPGKARGLFRKGIVSPLLALGGVAVGAIIGLAVETGVQSTGVLGPGLEDLIAEQDEGFARIDAKLEALRSTTDPEEVARLSQELEVLLAEQRRLGQAAEDQLRGARDELTRLRDATLDERGAGLGADLWLKPGESASIGARHNVFSVVRFNFVSHTADIEANVNGVRQRMGVGDRAEFATDHGTWTVVFKQGEARADRRIGFDVIPPPDSD